MKVHIPKDQVVNEVLNLLQLQLGQRLGRLHHSAARAASGALPKLVRQQDIKRLISPGIAALAVFGVSRPASHGRRVHPPAPPGGHVRPLHLSAARLHALLLPARRAARAGADLRAAVRG